MRKLAAFVLALGVSSAAAFAQEPQDGAPVHDLGDRQQNQTYPLQLTAQNIDCKTPQDFRFDLSAAPWVIALEDPVVRQVAPGQGKTVPAQLDFYGTEPGPHEGVVSTICETCGFIPFVKNCRADKRDVILRVNITPAPPPQNQGVDAPEAEPSSDIPPLAADATTEPPAEDNAVDCGDEAPSTDLSAAQGPGDLGSDECAPPAGVASPPVIEGYTISQQLDSDLDPHLKGGERNALNEARRKAAASAEAFREAEEVLRNAQKKKKDCEDELAALKAALEQAQRDADAAKAAADAAQQALDNGPESKAVDDAQKAIDNFQQDVDDAQREHDRWKEAAQGQQDYLEIVIEQEGNLNSERGKNAKKYYEEADANRAAAKAALEQTKNSMGARQAALAAAQNARKAAQDAIDNGPKKAAADAAAKVQAMQANLTEKEKECLGLSDAAGDAAHAKGIAEVTAEEAADDAADAEKDAKAQALSNLKDEIKRKKDECERIKKEWDTKIRQMTGALKALEQTGYFKAGQFSGQRAAPDKLWTSYKRLGLGAALKVVNITGVQATRLLTGHTAKGRVGGPLYDAMLKSLQIAYGVAAIRQSELTPGTYAHGRTEGKALRDWLRENNHAWTDQDGSDARAVEEEMRQIMQNRNYVAEQMARAIEAMERCKAELAALEAKRAAHK